jgi:hypothetical protein
MVLFNRVRTLDDRAFRPRLAWLSTAVTDFEPDISQDGRIYCLWSLNTQGSGQPEFEVGLVVEVHEVPVYATDMVTLDLETVKVPDDGVK